MNQTLEYLTKQLWRISLITVVALGACGGQVTDDPSQTGLSESQCRGTPTEGCYGIDPEYCVELGCALYENEEAQGAPVCIGEQAPDCRSMTRPQLCGRVAGCTWAK